jgi:methylated-DNA-protein-cysteine methyltransferase-like protein
VTRNERVYAAVKRIPRGKVATYGQIARIAGLGPLARQVGYALRALDDDSVPWHRVVNGRGLVSVRSEADLQRDLLEAEGVVFDDTGRIDLTRYQWAVGR